MKYGGSWAKGFASAFDPVAGINLGLQWKERKKAQKKIDDAIEQLKLNTTELAAKFDVARADGTINQQEYSDAIVWALPLGDEIIGRVEKLYGGYRQFTKEQIDNELDEINAFYELSADLDFSNIEQMKAFRSNLTQEKAITKWDLIIKSIEDRGKPTQAEIFPSAEALREKYPKAGVEYTDEGYVPTFAEQKAPSAAEAKLNFAISSYNAGKISFDELSKYMGTYIAPEKMSAKRQEVELMKEYGATDEQIKNKLLGVTEPKPETVTTLMNWEKMFDIKAEEGLKTEEEYNRALELLKQSEDVYEPKHATWKEVLIEEVKGIGKDLKGITDKDNFNFLLNIYMQKLEEIKTKYPEVNLGQFPEFEEQKSWFEKLKQKVGL